MRAQSPNTELPENSLGRSLERDIERSTFFLSHHASMWFCSTLSKPPFLASSQQSKPFIFIYTEWPNTLNTISNSVWKFENSGYSKVCLFLLKVNYQERKRKSLVQMPIDSYFKESLLNQIWWKNSSKGSKGFIYGFILNIYWTMQRDQPQSLEPNCLDSNPDSTTYDVRIGL